VNAIQGSRSKGHETDSFRECSGVSLPRSEWLRFLLETFRSPHSCSSSSRPGSQSAKIYIGNKLCFVTTNESSVAYLYPGTTDVKVALDGTRIADKELKITGDPEIRQVDFNFEGLR
jgi:hypothetical protein